MERRSYLKTVGAGVAAAGLTPHLLGGSTRKESYIRLGGPLFGDWNGPGAWAELVKSLGYGAVNTPVKPGADEKLIREYEKAAGKNDIVIAEVGAWSNPLSSKKEEADKAFKKCVEGLQHADLIGARCCVNISGSKNPEYWAGPHKDNLTLETFDRIVEITRKIIDEVKPVRSFFALEAMPWSFPDSTESYLKLIKAIDREHFGVHLDPVNMITSPRTFYENGTLIREMFAKLGPYIKSCHAKDIILREDNFIPQLDELRPGLGKLDYVTFLRELSKFKDVPLIMEHLKTAEEYALAAEYIRSVGETINIKM